MKRFVVFLSSILLIIGVTGGAGAQYVDHSVPLEPSVDFYVGPGAQGNDRWIEWSHPLDWQGCEGEDGCPGCEYGFTLNLTIFADDVDGYGWTTPTSYEREDDEVWIYQGTWDETSNKFFMGYLEDFGDQTIFTGPDLTDASDAAHSESSWSKMSSELVGFDLDPSSPLFVRVLVEGDGQPRGAWDWECEIESSNLRIDCTPIPVPSALLLLGSGVIGLVGLRRVFS
ncbi:MAG: PEP-CTERM sorting domain-containing protein [Deltaproteobacteria bacterium]|nr:PEP-CTERM sorting domain-containing protein [Deltaproteobacteria bacterium]